MDSRFRSLLESGAFLIGAALIVSVLIGGKVTGGWAAPGLDVTLDAQRSTALDVVPETKLTARRTLRPSPVPRGVGMTLSVRNATGAPVALGARTALTARELDGMLDVRVYAHGKVLFSGSLGELRRGAPLGVLPSHESVRMHIEAWLPYTARGYEAQTVRVPLTFDTGPVD